MSETARPKAGETVRIDGWGSCIVRDASDASLITLEIVDTGRLVKVGDIALLGLIQQAEA